MFLFKLFAHIPNSMDTGSSWSLLSILGPVSNPIVFLRDPVVTQVHSETTQEQPLYSRTTGFRVSIVYGIAHARQ